MSQVGSPPSTARPAPTAPAVTGAAVTPTPTDQATGNAPRHQGGGQPAPQHQSPPQAPAPPAPAVTLAGALTALFSGQPVKATVEASSNGQVVLRLPEAQLVIAAEAIEAARGDVLVLRLVAAGPTPTILITGRNGRPVNDPAPLPVSIEPVPEATPAALPALRRPVPLPAGAPPTVTTALEPVPVATVIRPAATTSPPVAAAPAKSVAAAPAAPPIVVEPAPPPAPVEQADPASPAPSRAPPLQPVMARPVINAPAAAPAMPGLAREASPAPATPMPVASAVDRELPLPREPLPKPQLPTPRAAGEPVRITAPVPRQAEPAPPRIAVSSAPAVAEADTAPIRSGPRENPAPITPAPPRSSGQRPAPFIPPEVPADAPRPSAIAHAVNVARNAPPPVQASVARPLAAPQVTSTPPGSAAAAGIVAAAKPTAPSAAPITAAPAVLPELAPIEIEPLPPADAPIDRRAASAWTALWATMRVDPVAAERIREMLQPKAGGRLGGGLAFLISALRGGQLADWLAIEDSGRLDLPSRPDGRRTVEAEFRDLSRMAQERGPDGWRAMPLAVLDAGAVQPVMLYVHRPPRRRKTDPGPDEASERFMLDLKLSRAGPMRIDGLLRPKALDVILRTERAVPSRIQRELRQVFTTALEGAGLAGTLGFQKVDHLPPPPAIGTEGKPHHAVLA